MTESYAVCRRRRVFLFSPDICTLCVPWRWRSSWTDQPPGATAAPPGPPFSPRQRQGCSQDNRGGVVRPPGTTAALLGPPFSRRQGCSHVKQKIVSLWGRQGSIHFNSVPIWERVRGVARTACMLYEDNMECYRGQAVPFIRARVQYTIDFQYSTPV